MLDIFWYLPTQGDEHYLGINQRRRKPTFEYLQQVAQAVDGLGYGGMLIGTGTKLDPWIVAAALIPVTRRLKFLIADRPSIKTPALAARMAATFDQMSGGRVLFNIVTGGSTAQLESDGVFQDHDARYEITDEYLEIPLRLMHGETVTFEGKHLRIKNATQGIAPVQQPHPPIYFGGSSPAALLVAAKHADVYLTWGEPPAQVEEKIAEVRALAAKQGRTLRFGIRLYVIARETEDEAWAAADRLIQQVDDDTIARTRAAFSTSESEGQRRMAARRPASASKRRTDLEISPNLWTGVSLARGGAGTALVGSAENIAARIREYADLGLETFVLSGYPGLEEAYNFAELVFPLLPINEQEAGFAITGGANIELSGGGAHAVDLPAVPAVPAANRPV